MDFLGKLGEVIEDILKEIQERHKLETERDIAPFVKAEDAILIDSTNMTIEEVVDRVIEIIDEERLENK